MTDRELKKLTRADLLELLVAQTKENEQLREQIGELKKQLKNRELSVQNAGTLAEAALQLNEVFAAADAASAQYLENIKRMSGEQEAYCAKLQAEAENKCRALETEVQERCRVLETQTREKCRVMTEETAARCEAKKAEAEKASKQYWLQVSKQMEEFYAAHKGLKELLASAPQ